VPASAAAPNGDSFIRARQQGIFERVDAGDGFVDAGPDEQPEIGGDLVVARPCRVKFSCHRPDQFAEPLLDVHVDILERRVFGQLARRIFRGDPVEPGDNRRGVTDADNALLTKHRRMRL
jgi:hypothetical protein